MAYSMKEGRQEKVVEMFVVGRHIFVSIVLFVASESRNKDASNDNSTVRHSHVSNMHTSTFKTHVKHQTEIQKQQQRSLGLTRDRRKIKMESCVRARAELDCL